MVKSFCFTWRSGLGCVETSKTTWQVISCDAALLYDQPNQGTIYHDFEEKTVMDGLPGSAYTWVLSSVCEAFPGSKTPRPLLSRFSISLHGFDPSHSEGCLDLVALHSVSTTALADLM